MTEQKRKYVIEGESFRIYEAELTEHEADIIQDAITELDESCGNCLDYPILQLESDVEMEDD